MGTMIWAAVAFVMGWLARWSFERITARADTDERNARDWLAATEREHRRAAAWPGKSARG